MNNKLVFCIVILATIFVSGCLETPMDNLNNLMKDINADIANSDQYFNEGVVALNSKDYVLSDSKSNQAIKGYENAKKNILETNKYYSDINETLYIEYINLLEDEVDLKLNASSNLLIASQKFKANDISAGNNHAQMANSKMSEALQIQNQRNNIVLNNPDLFDKNL